MNTLHLSQAKRPTSQPAMVNGGEFGGAPGLYRPREISGRGIQID